MPADDEETSGPPPHPLDRVWFHPSELGSSVTAIRPQPAAPRVWIAAALALLVGIAGTLGVVSMIGAFTDGATNSNRVQRTITTPIVDPDAVATLVTSVGRSIVTVSVVPAAGGDPTVAGSGVVIAPGQILTAAHLVTDQASVSVITSVSQVVATQVVGVDAETDLAVLKVDDADLAPARLSTGDSLRIGQSVAALAAGHGPRRWVSPGVLAGINQFAPLASGIQGAALLEFDSRLEPTAAGGALLDSSGAVIGILTGTDHFAVPIDMARDVAAQLVASGKAAHGWLGVIGADAIDRSGGGVRVKALVPDSPVAAPEGLQLDDVVVSVGDVEVGTIGDLVASVRRLKPGDPVEMTVIRAGKRIHVSATLGASVPAAPTYVVAG